MPVLCHQGKIDCLPLLECDELAAPCSRRCGERGCEGVKEGGSDAVKRWEVESEGVRECHCEGVREGGSDTVKG